MEDDHYNNKTEYLVHLNKVYILQQSLNSLIWEVEDDIQQ